MAPTVDGAILQALCLDPDRTTIASHGGSGFASTFKLTTTVDGQRKHYFVKTGSGADAETMFRGEHVSLNAIADAVPEFCPRSHAHGAMHAANRYFLATDFLDLEISSPSSSSSSAADRGSGLSLAAKLAKLHTTAAPIPDGYSTPMFGFPVPTCCGPTAQDNTWTPSWAEFYADRRLRGILAASVRARGQDAELAAAVEAVAVKVVPRLIGVVRDIAPVVVHGDLWSGNYARGRIAGRGGVEEVVYDPSAVYGHSEYELGMMRMFGSLASGFWAEYCELMPKAEPQEEWEDRLVLYELYHHLNHHVIFGSGYRSGAMSIMKRLISKYGS